MEIFPSIDLYKGKVVRLYKGDYEKMTIYSNEAEQIALDFKKNGAKFIHIVDLEGAKDGTTPNFETVLKIKKESGLFCEIGGGIRSLETIKKYLDNGIDRVIIGTSAVTDESFFKEALLKYGEKIVLGVDIKDKKVAIKGWKETSNIDVYDFCEKMQKLGVKTIICTDISKDGAMQGTNLELYKDLQEKFEMDIIASGGVSSLEDIIKLKEMNIYGAIIGKAYYIKALSLKEAIEVSK